MSDPCLEGARAMRPHRTAIVCLMTWVGLTGAIRAADCKDLPPDLAAVPANAIGFAHVRLADLVKSDPFKGIGETVVRAATVGLTFLAHEEELPSAAQFERLTVIVLPAPHGAKAEPLALTVLRAARPFDRAAFVKQLRYVVEHKERRGVYYVELVSNLGLHLIDDQTIAFGEPDAVQVWLDRDATDGGPFAEALRLATGGKMFVAAVNPQALPAALRDRLPKNTRLLLKANVASLTCDACGERACELRLRFPDEQGAKAASDDLVTAFRYAGEAVDALADGWRQAAVGRRERATVPELGLMTLAITSAEQLRELFEEVPSMEQEGNNLRMTLKLPAALATVLGTYGIPAVAALPVRARISDGIARSVSARQMFEIAKALHGYESTYGTLPPAALCDRKGKPLLSWRVLILPYVGHSDLYKRFKQDEPWDSEHNKQLIPLMPKVFASPAAPPREGETNYRVFVGGGALFEWLKGIPIAEIPDGSSNTITVVEAGQSVAWTKPDELEYDPDKPLPKLGTFYRDKSFLVMLGDGVIRSVSPKVSEKTLRRAITRADNMPLGEDW